METVKLVASNIDVISQIVVGLVALFSFLWGLWQKIQKDGLKSVAEDYVQYTDELEDILEGMVKQIGHDKEVNGKLKKDIEKEMIRRGKQDKLHKIVSRLKRGGKKVEKVIRKGKKILKFLSPFF